MPSAKKATPKSTTKPSTKLSFSYRLVKIDDEVRITACTVDANGRFVALENDEPYPAELVSYSREGMLKDCECMREAFNHEIIDMGQPALLG